MYGDMDNWECFKNSDTDEILIDLQKSGIPKLDKCFKAIIIVIISNTYLPFKHILYVGLLVTEQKL